MFNSSIDLSTKITRQTKESLKQKLLNNPEEFIRLFIEFRNKNIFEQYLSDAEFNKEIIEL